MLNELQEGWERYEGTLSPDTPQAQRLQLRQAFYAGVAVAVSMLRKAFLPSHPRP